MAGRILFGLVGIACLIGAGATEAGEPVRLQLRWDHQFQFAGYYVARWLGYYEDAGLDVTLVKGVERVDGKLVYRNAVAEVAEGRAQFGVGSTNVLAARNEGVPLAVTATFLQKSPTVVFVRKSARVAVPADLAHLRIHRFAGDTTDLEFQAMLEREGIDPDSVPPVSVDGPVLDQVRAGTIDGFVGYATSSIWEVLQSGLPMTALRPYEYGVDFYGDSLFTGRGLIDTRPELVQRFTEASIRGWTYAFEHWEEVADRISAELERTLPRNDLVAFNRFQAQEILKLSLFPIVSPGHTNPARWQSMQWFLERKGAAAPGVDLASFVFDPARLGRAHDGDVRGLMVAAVAGTLVLAGVLVVWVVSLRVRHRIEQERIAALQASERQYRDMYENAPVPFFSIKAEDGTVVRTNRAFRDVFDLTKPEAAGLNFFDMFAAGPDGAPQARALLLEIGNCRPVRASEMPMTTKGGTPLWVDVSIEPLVGSDGQIVECRCVLNDVTKRKEAERELVAARDELERRVAERTEELAKMNQELEEFSYVASHDLQEPLRTLSSYTQLLERDLGGSLDDRVRDDIRFINDAARRMRALVRDLLAFSRAGRVDLVRKPVDLDQCMAQIERDMLVAITEADGVVEWSDLPVVSGDFTQLKSVFQNLVSNGLKFRRPNEPPRIAVSAARTGPMWEVAISDNGIGIDAAYRDDVFLPFKRLHGKGEYDGSGIGLAIVRKVVERHGGQIRVESTIGHGSTFRFTLPAAADGDRETAGAGGAAG